MLIVLLYLSADEAGFFFMRGENTENPDLTLIFQDKNKTLTRADRGFQSF